jgi:hypothetical protein
MHPSLQQLFTWRMPVCAYFGTKLPRAGSPPGTSAFKTSEEILSLTWAMTVTSHATFLAVLPLTLPTTLKMWETTMLFKTMIK